MSRHPRVPLSVLDLAPISSGSDVRQALANTVDPVSYTHLTLPTKA